MPDLIIDDTIFQEFGKEVLKKNKKYERWHNFFKTEDYKKSSLHDLVELIKPSHEYIIKSGGVESPKDKTIKKEVSKETIIDEYIKVIKQESKNHKNKAAKYHSALIFLFKKMKEDIADNKNIWNYIKNKYKESKSNDEGKEITALTYFFEKFPLCGCRNKCLVKIGEGEIENTGGCPYHLLEYPSVTSCMTITCFLDNNAMVGMHEALKKRVNKGRGLNTLSGKIQDKNVTKVSAAGHGDFWAYKDQATELITGEEYEKIAFEDREDYHIIDGNQNDFLKWLVRVLGVNVRVEYINEGQGDYLVTMEDPEWKMLFKKTGPNQYKEVEVKQTMEVEEALTVNETYPITKDEVDSGQLLGTYSMPLGNGYNDLKKKLEGTLEDEDKEFSIVYKGKRRNFEIVEWSEAQIRAKYTEDL